MGDQRRLPTAVLTSARSDTDKVLIDYASRSTPPDANDSLALDCFLCGAMVIIPWLTGFLAIGMAYVCWRGESRPSLRDRAFMIAGLVLGGLNLLLWTLILISGYPRV